MKTEPKPWNPCENRMNLPLLHGLLPLRYWTTKEPSYLSTETLFLHQFYLEKTLTTLI